MREGSFFTNPVRIHVEISETILKQPSHGQIMLKTLIHDNKIAPWIINIVFKTLAAVILKDGKDVIDFLLEKRENFMLFGTFGFWHQTSCWSLTFLRQPNQLES